MMQNASDYEVAITIRNGRIKEAMKRNGIRTVAELCRRCGMMSGQHLMGKILNLKESPLGKRGQWRSSVLRMADALRVLPEDLFTEQQLGMALEANTKTVGVNEDTLLSLHGPDALRLVAPDDLEDRVQTHELQRTVESVLNTLQPREADMLARVFGLRGYAPSGVANVADEMGISSTRVGQIIAKAIRKLRHPDRAQFLAPFVVDPPDTNEKAPWCRGFR